MAAVAIAAAVLILAPDALVAQKNSRPNAVPARPDARTVAHVLNRLAFGARPGDVERVQQIGLATYIDQQLHPDRIPNDAMEARLSEFMTLTMSSRELSEEYFVPALALRREQQLKVQRAEAKAAKTKGAPTDETMTAAGDAKPQTPPELRQANQEQRNVVIELMQAKILRAALSDRQLEEVLTDFWFNHFNVFVQKGQVRQYITEYERDAIRPHVLGRFRDLLGATAHSPAMLFYLDNWQSASPNTPVVQPQLERMLNDPRTSPRQRAMIQLRQQQQGPQRPRRGLNENYGRELMELHTLGVDGGYTQKDVIEVARAFTGWSIRNPRQGSGFMFDPRVHDTGEKTILGVRFPSGGGQEEGERVLDMLARHPSTAHHIAFQLAQRFVADEPPAALVDRAAKVFLDTNGDLRQVVGTIVTSPEFFAESAYRAKVKSPFEFVVSAVRATNATIDNAQPLVQINQQLGMPIYGCQPPTGYSNTADAWVNTGSLLNRMNFALQLMNGQVRGGPQGRPGGPPPPGGPAFAGRGQFPPGRPGQFGRGPIHVDIAAIAPDTTDASRDRVIETILSGRVSDATRQTLARAESPEQLLALTLGSPEFQRR